MLDDLNQFNADEGIKIKSYIFRERYLLILADLSEIVTIT
jgi:hypothetical protein